MINLCGEKSMAYLLCGLLSLLSSILFASDNDFDNPLQGKKVAHVMPNKLNPFIERLELEHATVFSFVSTVSLDTFDEALGALVQAAVACPKPTAKSVVLSPTVYLCYKWDVIFEALKQARDGLCNVDYISFSGSDLSLDNLKDLFVVYQGFTSKERSPVFEVSQTPAAQDASGGFIGEFLARHKEEGQAFLTKVSFE